MFQECSFNTENKMRFLNVSLENVCMEFSDPGSAV